MVWKEEQFENVYSKVTGRRQRSIMLNCIDDVY